MRRALALALAASLFIAGTAQASTYTERVSGSQPLAVPFTLSVDGPVTAVATFTPRKGTSYSLRIENYHLCGGVICILPGDDVWCYVIDIASPLTCDVPLLAAGSYRAIFVNHGGPAVTVSLTIEP